MKLLYPILFLILFSSWAFGQQTSTLRGSVRSSSGDALSHITVRLEGKTFGAVTNQQGEYVIERVPYGKYKLVFSGIEFKKKSISIVVHKESVVQDISLDLVEENVLEETLVQRNTKKRELETGGFSINVIDMEKASLQSIQTNELLDRSAGVRIRQDGGLGSHIHYNINGLSGNAVKIFIDGVPSTNFGSAFSLNSIPPALIERIEIYKGVVPGNLSEDALGGAINVVLKKQKSKSSLLTSYSLGSFNTHQWNMTGSFHGDKGFGVDASAFYNYSDNDYEVWGENISYYVYNAPNLTNQRAKRFHDAYRSYGGRANFGYTNVKWADRFMLGGVLSKDYKEVQHGRTMDKPYGDRHTRGNTSVATLTYEKKDILLEGLSLKVDASYSYLERQVIDSVGLMYDWRGEPLVNPTDGSYFKYNTGAEASNTGRTAAINSDKTLVTRANLSYSINLNHHFYVNYLFNNFKRGTSDALEALGLQLLDNTRDLQKNILSFTYENVSFSKKLRTNLFYKHYFQKVTSNEPYQITANPPEYGLNVFDRNRNHAGYGLALSYAVLPRLYLLGSAEKAIRLPNANEIFGNEADNLLPPTTELEPEKSYNANIGVNWGPHVFDQHSIKLNSSIFYRNTQGMIREGLQSGNNDNTRFENLEDVETKGIDAEILYSYAGKFDLSFNISKINSLFNTEFNSNGQPYLYYRTQLRNEPSFKFNTNLVYHFSNLLQKNARMSVYYNVNYVKGFLRNWANVGGNNLDRIPTQFANDIGFAYTLPSRKMTLSFDAKNIFNQQIFDNFGLQKPGRAFYTKVTYTVF